MPSTPYSTEEKRILRRRYKAGDTAAAIAQQLGRTERSVYHQAAKMKLKHGLLYTAKERKTIKRMHADGKTPEEIATELERPLDGLCKKMNAMKLFSARSFTKKDERKLRRLRREGLNAVQIAAEFPDRDVTSIRGKLSRMGLGDPEAKKHLPARKARRMTSAQHNLFCTFLRNCTNREDPFPVLEIMLLWNQRAQQAQVPEVTRDKVEYWLEKLKLPVVSGKDVKRMCDAAHKRRQRVKRKTLKQGQQKKDEKEMRRLRRLRTKILKGDAEVETSICPRCPESDMVWPVTPDFFYFTRSSDGTLTPRVNMCIMCSKKHRRAISDLKAQGVSHEEIRAWQKRVAKQAHTRKMELIQWLPATIG